MDIQGNIDVHNIYTCSPKFCPPSYNKMIMASDPNPLEKAHLMYKSNRSPLTGIAMVCSYLARTIQASDLYRCMLHDYKICRRFALKYLVVHTLHLSLEAKSYTFLNYLVY